MHGFCEDFERLHAEGVHSKVQEQNERLTVEITALRAERLECTQGLDGGPRATIRNVSHWCRRSKDHDARNVGMGEDRQKSTKPRLDESISCERKAWGMMWNNACSWTLHRDRPTTEAAMKFALALWGEEGHTEARKGLAK